MYFVNLLFCKNLHGSHMLISTLQKKTHHFKESKSSGRLGCSHIEALGMTMCLVCVFPTRWTQKLVTSYKWGIYTVDGRNPAPPGMYKTDPDEIFTISTGARCLPSTVSPLFFRDEINPRQTHLFSAISRGYFTTFITIIAAHLVRQCIFPCRRR